MRRTLIAAAIGSMVSVVFAQRGAPPPSGPTPRLADGTPNLGRANGELAEYICQENNKDLTRLTNDFGQPLFGRKP